MKDTYINWTPSARLIKKAQKVYTLHESGLTYPQIAKKVKHPISYLSRLSNWYKNNILNKEVTA